VAIVGPHARLTTWLGTYVDPVTALPVALTDDGVRTWRRWREGLHDDDIQWLVDRRPLWDAVVLPLMLARASSRRRPACGLPRDDCGADAR